MVGFLLKQNITTIPQNHGNRTSQKHTLFSEITEAELHIDICQKGIEEAEIRKDTSLRTELRKSNSAKMFPKRGTVEVELRKDMLSELNCGSRTSPGASPNVTLRKWNFVKT